MKICYQCDRTYKDSVNYCPKCGEELFDENVVNYHGKGLCAKCGFVLDDYMDFCPKCGNQINLTEQTVSKQDLEKKESVNNNNSSERITPDGLVIIKQIIYTLMCIGFAIGVFSILRPKYTLASKLICSLTIGIVVLYILVTWNYVKKQYLSKSPVKSIIATIGGLTGFAIVCDIHWRVLNSYSFFSPYKFFAENPVRMDSIDGIMMMMGTTIGIVGVIMGGAAVIYHYLGGFFIRHFIKVYQK